MTLSSCGFGSECVFDSEGQGDIYEIEIGAIWYWYALKLQSHFNYNCQQQQL